MTRTERCGRRSVMALIGFRQTFKNSVGELGVGSPHKFHPERRLKGQKSYDTATNADGVADVDCIAVVVVTAL